MDVARRARQVRWQLKRRDGFTLIESVVATGLFAGVVLLLVSVFNEFLIDDYNTKLNKALLIAENQIENAGRGKVFESTGKDTMGFHITQTVTVENRVMLVDVTVEEPARGMKGTQPEADAPLAQKKSRTQYVKLTKAFPVN